MARRGAACSGGVRATGREAAGRGVQHLKPARWLAHGDAWRYGECQALQGAGCRRCCLWRAWQATWRGAWRADDAAGMAADGGGSCSQVEWSPRSPKRPCTEARRFPGDPDAADGPVFAELRVSMEESGGRASARGRMNGGLYGIGNKMICSKQGNIVRQGAHGRRRDAAR